MFAYVHGGFIEMEVFSEETSSLRSVTMQLGVAPDPIERRLRVVEALLISIQA